MNTRNATDADSRPPSREVSIAFDKLGPLHRLRKGLLQGCRLANANTIPRRPGPHEACSPLRNAPRNPSLSYRATHFDKFADANDCPIRRRPKTIAVSRLLHSSLHW